MSLPRLSLEIKCRILDHLDSLSSIALVWKDVLLPIRQRRFRSIAVVKDSHIGRLFDIILSEPKIAKLIHQLEVAEYGYGFGDTYECPILPHLLARLPGISNLKLNKLCTISHSALLPHLLAVLPPSKLTKVSLDFAEWTEAYRILFMLHSFPHVEDLRISGRANSTRPVEHGGPGVDIVELYQAPAFESVKRLELSGYQLCCNDMLRVLAHSGAFPNLESLTLASATVSGGWMKRLGECCARWPTTLRELRLPSLWLACTLL
ncbi:hypothetical protein CYLTODRAFT_52811 [Cylindrobasidium torrendii FP15055 ss-10]|uniref:F-box domain-containing protein n=1 Tax=Cylindrobasidium torrendii FP15055 ss-10 TaxID=1314674 RepID=A0A0D7B6I4_9AGAR|nr:hypothetical protein CYLTODRAFT_52811 [Cylindrobasidium torrendii FP15055 ss-10]